MNIEKLRDYPKAVPCEDGEVVLRLMGPEDEAAMVGFACSLPKHDLLFLRRDITQPKVVSAWVKEIELGNIVSLLALRGDRIVGCNALVRDELSWSRHVGDVRVVVGTDMRGQGLGRVLTQECFAIALSLGLEKLTAQMTVDQSGAISVFESLGFRGEALLRDHVKDREGAKHDIVILSHDVARFGAQMKAYGLTEAF